MTEENSPREGWLRAWLPTVTAASMVLIAGASIAGAFTATLGGMRSDFREDLGAMRSDFRADLSELREEIRSGFAEMRVDNANLGALMRDDLNALTARIDSLLLASKRRRKNAPAMSPCRFWRGAGDVRRGALCGGSSGGCRRGSEPSRGGAAVRHRPSDGEEDAELFGAAGVSPDEAGPAAQAGRVHRHRRRDPGGGHGSGRAAQAASHGAPDLRAAAGRARVHRRLHHRERLCPGPAAVDARGLRAAASPAGPCPGRLRRGGGGVAGPA